MQTPVRPSYVNTEDPQISRWQSAVAAHVRRSLVAAGKPASPSDVNAHPMCRAAREHALAEEKGLLLSAPSDAERAQKPYQPHDSQKVFHKAFPERAPGGAALATPAPTAAPSASSSDDRSPADDNTNEWLAVFYENEKLLTTPGAEPQYIDNGGNMNLGVVPWTLPDDATVIVLGDWGSGNDDAIALLADAIKQAGSRLAAIVHLGDVYYSGQPDECTDNIVNATAQAFKQAGTSPVPMFWVPGNHEYYSFGAGYYSTIGLMNAGNKDATQVASYFALRTKSGSYQILGMDTGQSDFIAGQGTVFGAPTVQLRASEIEWHQDKLSNFKGSTILLSHHQLMSSAVTVTKSVTPWVNASLWQVFSPYFQNIALWLWGHEHNQQAFYPGMFGLGMGSLIGASAYEEATSDGGLTAVNGLVQTTGTAQLTPSDGYFNHGYGILDLKGDGSVATLSYYTFPSWDQGQAPKDPKGTLVRTDNLKTPAQQGSSNFPPAANLLRYLPQGMSPSHQMRLSVSTSGATGSWTVLDQNVTLAQTIAADNIAWKGGKSGVYSLSIQIQSPTAGASPTCKLAISFQQTKGSSASVESTTAAISETTSMNTDQTGLSSLLALTANGWTIDVTPRGSGVPSSAWSPNVVLTLQGPSGDPLFLAIEDTTLG
ncbi:MAG: metallophosphoesterase [Polyangiaceae bacterium]